MAGGTTRRELFQVGAEWLGAGWLGAVWWTATAGAAATDPDTSAASQPALDVAGAAALARRWLRNPAAARALGERYLAAHPGERDPERLLAGSLGPGDAAGAAQRFARRRHDEFASGETVELSGWRMSRSEARLCALLALA